MVHAARASGSPAWHEAPLKPTIKAAVHAVAAALSALPVPGMIIGGIAVIARGVPRLTRDVDATIAGGTIDVTDLLDRLRGHGLVPRIDERLLVLYGPTLDLARIRRIVGEFAAALEAPERVDGLEPIIRRVGLA